MTNEAQQHPASFSHDTRASFQHYLHEHPSNRRVSLSEKANLIQWLIDPDKRPSSQREFSRRNYARKTFVWDGGLQDLLAINGSQGSKNRIVVAEDRIVDVVEFVHNRNGHAGWDATWKDISASYHGILRSDVIYLLKRCQACMHNPSKRPKNLTRAATSVESEDATTPESLNANELEYNTYLRML